MSGLRGRRRRDMRCMQEGILSSRTMYDVRMRLELCCAISYDNRLSAPLQSRSV